MQVVAGQQQPVTRRERDRQHGKQSRKDSPRPPFVKTGEGKAAFLDLAADDAGDQVAGNHEKNVHADEAARDQ